MDILDGAMTSKNALPRLTIIVSCACCLTIAGARDGNSASIGGIPAGQAVYAIAGIRAFFYFQETGQFGEKDIVTGTEALWNVSTGGGGAHGTPTTATLVLVDLSGPRFDLQTPGTLELQARTGNQSLLNTRQRLSAFVSEKNRISIPFILYGTGCAPVEMMATLSSGPKSRADVKKASIAFQCGE